MVLSPSGGLWVSCFACGDVADVLVWLGGVTHGQAIQLERGACAGCAFVLLHSPLPMTYESGDQLLEVRLQLVANFDQELTDP